MNTKLLWRALLGGSALLACDSDPPDTQLGYATILGERRLIEYTIRDDELAIFEGDLLVRRDEIQPLDAPVPEISTSIQGVAATTAPWRWTNALVPYVIDPSIPTDFLPALNRALAHWQRRTPIRFVQRTGETYYLRFKALPLTSRFCGLSFVGRQLPQANGQIVEIRPDCSSGALMHEIGHAIGLHHEHSRTDRDTNITVHRDKILDPDEQFFATYAEAGEAGTNIGPYNFASLMHYEETAFRCPGCTGVTISRTDGLPLNPATGGLSMGDHNGVRSMYCDALAWDPRRCTQDITVGDYDGDGLRDFAMVDSRDHKIWVSRASFAGGGFGTSSWGGDLPLLEYSKHLAVDVDRDGTDEFLSINNEHGLFLISRKAGGPFFLPPEFVAGQTISPNGWQELRSGNFNNDVWPDLAIFYAPNATWWVYLNDGTGHFNSPTLWADFTDGPWTMFEIGRFNNDNLDDIVSFYEPNATWWLGRSTGSSFQTSLAADYSDGGWVKSLSGDFSGDGIRDIMSFNEQNATWWLMTTGVNQTFNTVQVANFSDGGWTHHVVGRFNNDALADIASYNVANGTWWVGRSNGNNTFDFTVSGQNVPAATLFPANGWSSQVAMEVTNDGRTDIVNFSVDGSLRVVSPTGATTFSNSTWADFCILHPAGICARMSQ